MKWTRRASAKDSTRGRRRSSLQVEPLEGRALLAAAATLSQVLVAEHYQVFLGRPTDAAGLASWTAQLDRGVSPNTVSLGIATSAESATDYVTNCYKVYLGRTPDSGGLNFWLGQLKSGRTPNQVAASILGSPEYFARAGSTNQGFITALYRDVLGRDADTSSNTFWLNALASGVSRTTVAFDFLTSPEEAGNQAASYYNHTPTIVPSPPAAAQTVGVPPPSFGALVSPLSGTGIFNRAPDSAGLSAWTNSLTGPNPKLTQAQVLVDFLDSSENITRINTAIAAAPTTATPDQIAEVLLGLPVV
jgi:hypothetical protein